MQEFAKITTKFLSKRPLCDSICVFNDILREEQIKRKAHISCLPFEVILLIMYMVEGSTINIHRNIYKYLSVVGKDQMNMLREQSQTLSKRWLKLKEACRSLIGMNINEEFPIIILAQTDTRLLQILVRTLDVTYCVYWKRITRGYSESKINHYINSKFVKMCWIKIC